MKVTILGAGAFGSALGTILEENYHSINFYDPIKHPNIPLNATIRDTGIIIIATPSTAIPKLISELPKDTPLINASKGLLSAQIFAQFTNFSIISGGTFAKDLEEKKPNKFTVTAKLPEKLFQTKWITFDHTDDLDAVLICGSLKNVYAIGAGLNQLASSTRPEQDYLNDCLLELRAFLAANNHDPNIAELACGRDDLFATCLSTESRNYQFGKGLATDKQPVLSGTIEGVNTIKALANSNLKMPPLTILNNIIERVTDALK